jgi:hypothetical protein
MTAALAALALPAFLVLERRLGFAQRGSGLFSTGNPKT